MAVPPQPDDPPEQKSEDANRDADSDDSNQLCQPVDSFFPARVVPAELEREQGGHQFVGGSIPLPRVHQRRNPRMREFDPQTTQIGVDVF